jgi:putative transposase
MFVGMLNYKARLYGRHFGKIDRWFPSTRMCSDCGRVRKKLPLSVRKWTCPCGSTHDRDVKAAKKILAAGCAERVNACGDAVRPPLVVAAVDEAGTHRSAA